MPKIIENLRENLLAEARRQIAECGYNTMTVRSVARACGVGVGTVYNYYASKDALVASFMLEDWNTRLTAIHAVGQYAQEPEPLLRCIYDQLTQFEATYHVLFQDAVAASSFAGSFSTYHVLLRSQLANPICRFCTDSFTAEFIAEALLSWTMAGKSFEEVFQIVKKLF